MFLRAQWLGRLSITDGLRIVGGMSLTPTPIELPRAPGDGGFQPFELVNAECAATAPLVVLCDHASNALPDAYGTLGLPSIDLERHIGWDIGAADVTRRLAHLMGVPAVLSGFSRLLIDPNRGADDPTLVMKLSDGAVIPGNRQADAAEIAHRRANYWQPYQDAAASMIEAAMAGGQVPVIVSIHSFTPVWRGAMRPWQCGVLWDRDPRLPHLLLAGLRSDSGLVVGDNEPYSGRLHGDTMYRNGTSRGLANALVEIRQDLIDTHHGAQEWAERLAQILGDAIKKHPELAMVKHFASYTEDGA